MSHSMELQGYGVSFRLRAGDFSLLQEMAARGAMLGWTGGHWPTVDIEYVVHQITGTDGSFQLECDGALLHGAGDLTAVLDAFENHAKIEMAFRASGWVFVHAGVVGWQGAAILLPGRSRAGKTTLVEALVERGAEYYSDEFAVLDRSGRVHPYTLPLSIRARGGRPATRTPVESLGGCAGVAPLPVGLIVVTRYQLRGRWRPRPLSRAEALLALMDNTVAATRPPAQTMPILREAVARARIIESTRGDAARVARRLLAQISPT
jgi:hypothetical protein